MKVIGNSIMAENVTQRQEEDKQKEQNSANYVGGQDKSKLSAHQSKIPYKGVLGYVKSGSDRKV